MNSILGNTSAERFLAEYWQQKPLLVRGAIDDLPDVSGDVLAGLSLEEEVESRIVTEDGPWALRNGPFDEACFDDLPETHWTLLVQAVDLWLPAARSLVDAFEFLPPWRLDDVMVSYAAEGGSVGPHFDYYDVFLVQGQGRREWRIGERCSKETPLRDDTDLRILREFEPVNTWTLEPGDMLYLPPQVSHWGVALEDCMTFSVGFRAPTLAEMLGDLATELMALDNDSYYRDPPLTPSMANEEIASAFIDQAKALFGKVLEDDELIEDWFARYMTSPKYPGIDTELRENRRARTRAGLYVNGEK